MDDPLRCGIMERAQKRFTFAAKEQDTNCGWLRTTRTTSRSCRLCLAKVKGIHINAGRKRNLQEDALQPKRPRCALAGGKIVQAGSMLQVLHTA